MNATKIHYCHLNVHAYVTPTGVKFGARGKVFTAGYVLGRLPKGEARKLRKALRAAGHAAKAAAARQI